MSAFGSWGAWYSGVLGVCGAGFRSGRGCCFLVILYCPHLVSLSGGLGFTVVSVARGLKLRLSAVNRPGCSAEYGITTQSSYAGCCYGKG